MSLTVYGKISNGTKGSNAFDVSPSLSCVDASSIEISITPASCADSLLPFTESYYPTSYSYSKESLQYGQENWAFTTKPTIPGFTGEIVILRGIAEGTVATGAGIMDSSRMGITINETASNDALNVPIQGETGNIVAGTPGLGDFSISRSIIVTSIGASEGINSVIFGQSGETSISISNETVFL